MNQKMNTLFLTVSVLLRVASQIVPDPTDAIELSNYITDNINCKGKEGSRFSHPTDCTRYVQCVNEIPVDKLCPACIKNNLCPRGHFHFDSHRGRCDRPTRAKCQAYAKVSGGRNLRGAPSSSNNSIRASNLGDASDQPCDPANCKTEGYCLNYSYCERLQTKFGPLNPEGVVVQDTCGRDRKGIQLYFNQEKNEGHGGVCDYWVNLASTTKTTYSADPQCPIT